MYLLLAGLFGAMDAGAAEPLFLEIELQGAPKGTELVLREDGRLWLEAERWREWRLKMPGPRALREIDGKLHVALDSVQGLRYRLDGARMRLTLRAEAAAFEGSSLDLARRAPVVVDRPSTGAFVNYEITASHGAGRTDVGGWLEAVIFGAAGTATTTFFMPTNGSSARLVRLDTTLRREDPGALRTLRIGDGITPAGSWGRAYRFAGVEWGTDFALQPGLVTFPLPSASGSAVVPSVIEVYVDQVLRRRESVPAGPFELEGLPVTTGAGHAEILIRDAAGREQRIAHSFYASPVLLQPGLRASRYAVGFERRNYGTESFDYGEPLLALTERYGFSEILTGELHVEASKRLTRAGVGASYVAPFLGVVQATIAASASPDGGGWLAGVGFDRQTRALSLSGSAQWTTADFDVATPAGERTPRRRVQLGVGWSLARYGSLSAGYLRQDRAESDDLELIQLGYNVAIGGGFVSAFLLRTLAPERDSSLVLYYSRPLGVAMTANASVSFENDEASFRAGLQRSAPPGEGYGYRIAAEHGTRRGLDAGYVLQTADATYRIDARRSGDQSNVRAGVSGAIAWLGGAFEASRQLRDSFALVEVGGYPGVGIYAENQLVARTDAQGRALVPYLRAFEPNRLRVEQADLPLDASIGALGVIATPPSRSGLHVVFPIRRVRSAILRIVLDDGNPIELGSEAWVVGQEQPVLVGLDGRVYVEGLTEPTARLEVRWRGKSCIVPVVLPTHEQPLPDLGTHTCRGVPR